MYTVYYNDGEGWTYSGDYHMEQSAIEMIGLLQGMGYQATFSSPHDKPECDYYD